MSNAGVAQLAEHNVANVVVVGSNPITRSVYLFSLRFFLYRFIRCVVGGSWPLFSSLEEVRAMTSELDTDKTIDKAADEDPSTDGDQPRLELSVDVSEPSACERHITVTVPRVDIDRYVDAEIAKLMPEAQVPGFRAGRAPRKLVASHFKSEVAEQIKGKLLLDCMTQVSEDQKFSAISEPDFDFEAIDIPEEGPLTFEFDLEVRPEFEVPKWKGLKLDRPNRTIGKEQIDQHLEKLLERSAVIEPVDEAAKAGDFVVLNMHFSRDGETINSVEEVTIQLRPALSFRDANLEGFQELLKGAKAGDKKVAKVTVTPEAEDESLRGEEVDVEIELLDVKRLSLPSINEALLTRMGGFESEGDLRDAVKGELERQLGYRQNQKIRQQITSLLTESANWALPPEMLQRQAQRELERATMELRSSGFSDEQVQAHANVLRQNSQKSTATALKEHFILERIAEDEEMEASDDDYDHEIALIAMQSRESPRSVRARIDKRGMWDALRNQIVERKVVAIITKNATFKDVPDKPVEDNTSAVDIAVGGVSKAEIPDAKHGGDEQELKQPADRT
jgi:trigger factor